MRQPNPKFSFVPKFFRQDLVSTSGIPRTETEEEQSEVLEPKKPRQTMVWVRIGRRDGGSKPTQLKTSEWNKDSLNLIYFLNVQERVEVSLVVRKYW